MRFIYRCDNGKLEIIAEIETATFAALIQLIALGSRLWVES